MFTRFLWKGNIDTKGGAKIGWDSICAPLDEGGLGFKNSKEWNKAQILSHLCKIVNKSSALWPLWVNTTVLKRLHFWTLTMPNDCSWILRNVIKLRSLARQFITIKIGNGLGTSLWFDPWWNSTCLASHNNETIISQANLPSNATVHDLISTGNWILPTPSIRIHHLHPGLVSWLQHFNFPIFDLGSSDCISWNDLPLCKIRTWHIWNSLRSVRPQVVWADYIWHRFKIIRYAHHEWILCHGRLPTLHSAFILTRLAGVLKIHFAGTTWSHVLSNIASIQDLDLRNVGYLAAQIFAYHLWRERNARHHDKGANVPSILIKIIMVDLKSKLRSTSWFQRFANIDLYRWISI